MEKDRFSKTFPLRGTIPFIVISLIPLLAALAPCIWDGNGATFTVAVAFLSDQTLQTMLALSLAMAFLCALTSSWLGNAGAKLMVTNKVLGRGMLRTLFRLPAAVPPIVVVTGYMVLFGSGGLFGKQTRVLSAMMPAPLSDYLPLAGAAFIMVATCSPIVAAVVSSSWEKLDYRCEQAALTLGTPWKTVYRTITRPRLKEARNKAFALAFMNCLTEFVFIALLCKDLPVFTLATGMQILSESGHNATGAVLALISADISILGLAVYCSNDSRENSRSYQNPEHEWKPSKKVPAIRRIWISIYALVSFIVVLGPVIAVVAGSFISDRSFTIRSYLSLFQSLESPCSRAILFSLAIALVSAMAATFISTRVCSRCLRDRQAPIGFYLLPLACGPVVLSLGFSQIQKLLSAVGLGIPAIILVILADIAISVPLCVMFSVPGFRNLNDSLSACSRTLGFTSRETFRIVEKPNLIRGIRAGFCMAFAVSLGNLEIPLIIGGPDTKTLPVQIYGMLNNGAIQEACVLGSILVLICLILFLIGTKQERKRHA